MRVLLPGILLTVACAHDSVQQNWGNCSLRVDSIDGSGKVEVPPDEMSVNIEVASRAVNVAAKKAGELKSLVEDANIEGLRYSQTFGETTTYDPFLRRNVPFCCAAKVAITFPYDSENWETDGSTKMNELVAKILELDTDASEEAAEVQVTMKHSRFALSNPLRERSEQKALELAVQSAINRARSSVSPWLLSKNGTQGTSENGTQGASSFDINLLENVRIDSSTGGFMGRTYHSSYMHADSSRNAEPGDKPNLKFVRPENMTVSQHVKLSACIKLHNRTS